MNHAVRTHAPEIASVYRHSGKTKFFVGFLLIMGAVIYLIVTALSSTAQYFLTVSEFWDRAPTLSTRAVRVSGQVIGTSIRVDARAFSVSFKIVDNEAVPDRSLTVTYSGPKPDLLREEATAIVEGRLGKDGVFYADNVLLKCPSRYEEAKEETWSWQDENNSP